MSDEINDLIEFMTYRRNGLHVPLYAEKVNGEYIIALYQGSRGQNPELYFIIKYKQKINGQFIKTRPPRQPSHIHWAVDLLIKMHQEPERTEKFLDFLLEMWENTQPLTTLEERNRILGFDYLLNDYEIQIERYNELGRKGEYSIKFLILLLKLLMIQEKTSLNEAYMFKNVLEQLKSSDTTIYKVVSIAMPRGR
ncbi:MAG: hypothetical protein UR30_C0019G0009 [Candidatus Peregrinibacteria bacterium GW2011_GWC2_33_13]|nr:MAG: hypothetical protein UR30_C0019G0009 [Candidatus Peregrinibacteria bacterium GW2011_GWC2_33_13]